MNNERLLIIGCGILKKEVEFLIVRNKWPADTLFLDSSLHIDFDKLSSRLSETLKKYNNRNVIVLYGSCHPNIDNITESAGSYKLPVQNCIEMLPQGVPCHCIVNCRRAN